jgi:hypothetical protein
MTSPANYLLTLTTGDTETLSVTLQDSAGAPINITGRTYSAQVRATADSSTVLATFSCSITNAAAGTFACTLTATQTAALTPGGGVWDLAETNASTVTRLLGGSVIIAQGVTR